MFLAKQNYETHNIKLLAIVEAFKYSRNYLKSSIYEVLVFTNHNNFENLWISSVLVVGKSTRPKKFLLITFKSTIDIPKFNRCALKVYQRQS